MDMVVGFGSTGVDFSPLTTHEYFWLISKKEPKTVTRERDPERTIEEDMLDN
jgi:hypothetical protein